MTLIPITEHLAVDLIRSVAVGIRTPMEPPACNANALTDHATIAASGYEKKALPGS